MRAEVVEVAEEKIRSTIRMINIIREIIGGIKTERIDLTDQEGNPPINPNLFTLMKKKIIWKRGRNMKPQN